MLTLTNDSCQVQLAPQRGAIVTSLNIRGFETLYLDQATFKDSSSNVRGGIPVLFPLCGPQSEPATMRQHGFARNLPWTVSEKSATVAKLTLEHSEKTRRVYPYPFCYELLYSVLPTGLRIDQAITNLGTQPMPVQFGFHPYFLVGEKSELEFQLPVTTYQDNKSEDAGTFRGFDFDRDEIDWSFSNPITCSASFLDPQRGHQVTVAFGDEYTQLVFWSLRGKPFVCLEPWSSARFSYPNAQDIHYIKTGDCLRTHVEIHVSLDVGSSL